MIKGPSEALFENEAPHHGTFIPVLAVSCHVQLGPKRRQSLMREILLHMVFRCHHVVLRCSRMLVFSCSGCASYDAHLNGGFPGDHRAVGMQRHHERTTQGGLSRDKDLIPMCDCGCLSHIAQHLVRSHCHQ